MDRSAHGFIFIFFRRVILHQTKWQRESDHYRLGVALMWVRKYSISFNDALICNRVVVLASVVVMDVLPNKQFELVKS